MASGRCRVCALDHIGPRRGTARAYARRAGTHRHGCVGAWRNRPASGGHRIEPVTVGPPRAAPGGNHLLAALPDAERRRLAPQLERVALTQGQVLYDSGAPPAFVHFPENAIVSLLDILENGASAGGAIVGNEGVVGVALFMGGETTPGRAVVQIAGEAQRLPAALLKAEFHRGGPTMLLLLRYTQALIAQLSQTALCNRHHSVDQQLSRWLLLALDRRDPGELVMTQALIANLLGVRREGVSEAAGRLQDAGVIRYRRGRIEVLDRDGLRQRSCECYEVLRREYARLLPAAAPVRA